MSVILVTGATGFIGTHLCMRLVAEGHDVHALARSSQPQPDLAQTVRWSQADLNDLDSVRTLINRIRPEYVFHLASRVSGSRDLSEVVPMFQSNLASSVNLMASAVDAGCRRIVLAGSSEEPVEPGSTPCSPYSAAKISSTAYAHMFRNVYGLPVVVPRIFMTYGPRQHDLKKIVPYTILALLRGERPRLSSGRRMVDWIYVEDVVDGVLKAAFAPAVPKVTFDLGSGELVSIRVMIEQIVEIIGNGVHPEFGAIPDRPLEPERRANILYAQQAFGWKPNTTLRAGLEQTVRWYTAFKEHGSATTVGYQTEVVSG